MENGKRYSGLFGVPANDLNFTGGVERLDDGELREFLAGLEALDTPGNGQKGRIKAVQKEIKRRGGNSAEIVAVEKMAADIEETERLYSDGKIYDLERIRDEITFYQEQMGTSLLELGKRFIRIKAHEDHGKFLAVVEAAGMAYRSVAYAMAAARKFANVQTTAHLGNEKIRALTVLDDAEVVELESGGKARGMTFDDIDRMSVKELRENLRKSEKEVGKLKDARKKDRDAFEQSLTTKDRKLNEYELREAGMEPPTALKIAVGKAEEMRRDIFQKLLIASQYVGEAEALAQKITDIADISAEALTIVKEQLAEPYDALCNSYLALEDTWNAFFPGRKDAEDSGYAAS